MVCQGCQGKGWVETAGGAIVHVCPICKGTGWLADLATSSTNVGTVPSPEPE